MKKQIWQRNPEGILFWDSYLHEECLPVTLGEKKDCKQDEFRAIVEKDKESSIL